MPMLPMFHDIACLVYDDVMVHTIVCFTNCLLYAATIDGSFLSARYDIAKTHMQKLEPFTEITKAKAKASPTVPPIPARDADEATTVPGNNVAFLDTCYHAYIFLYYICEVIFILMCLHSMIEC